MPENGKINPKVTYASGGAAIGSAVATVAVWALEASTQIDVPGEVELALGVILTAGLAFLAGWSKRA
ncbi:hypothetical protein FVO59_12745 [Microbacterium esteraromaticum]|uniref:Uncharacterized protein n=1 Tax=Microbacterium esteraromaticum TaxID=57043 RepID=A0A7D7WH45_9MICO|nr:hypothetical protein [Microbacterium esteraromaticum]QMU97971.1 hypothetical protein FVO59_12745 [Microbacterium esteraromaticum]